MTHCSGVSIVDWDWNGNVITIIQVLCQQEKIDFYFFGGGGVGERKGGGLFHTPPHELTSLMKIRL